MLGFVTRLVGDDDGAIDPDPDPAATDGRVERPPTRLFECPDCESVYLSAEMTNCGSCDTGVEPVPSEDDLGLGTGDVGDS